MTGTVLASRLTRQHAGSPDGIRRFFDPTSKRDMVRVGPGSYFVTAGGNEVLTAVLGSCIAVCLRDPKTGIGGMNHFMLPAGIGARGDRSGTDLRCGAHAMEVLVNEILSRGCPRNRMEVKIFGGSDLFGAARPVGNQNATFAMDYLARERMPIAARDIGGQVPRRVEFVPATGLARVKLIRDDMVHHVVRADERYRHKLLQTSGAGDVELF